MANSVRQERVANAIFRILSTLLMNDNDLAMVSISLTRVKVTRDLREATILFVAEDEDPDLLIQTLSKKSGKFRHLMAKQLSHLKHVPALEFKFDKGQEKVEKLDKIFDQIARENNE